MPNLSSPACTIFCRCFRLFARYAVRFLSFGFAASHPPSCAGAVGFRTCHCRSRICLPAKKEHCWEIQVGNNGAYTADDWSSDIQLAASKGIDAFALNIAPPLQGTTASQVVNCYYPRAWAMAKLFIWFYEQDLAFQAAEADGGSFKLFFSFDYLGGGQPWSTADILSLLEQYGSSAAHFKVCTQALDMKCVALS
jgi:hypothetical protein